jgi:asparagine synthase (glutamine-hydrolysing)
MSVSGIAAIVNVDGSPVRSSDVERMANVLRPYGPDRQKTLVRNNAAFVFCLHQLTPEDLFEQQPLIFANRFVMLFDGRIDNRSELGDALNIGVSDLQLMPDSRIAMRLFDRWGEQSFERILGEFATIVMDLQEGHLICARDQMGLRVLHYHRVGTQFAVATNPEALFALSRVPRIWNKERVLDTLVWHGLDPEITYFKDIFRVPPGSIMRVRGSSLSKTQFWDPENISDVRFKTDQEYVEAFQEHFHAAVRARLRSSRVPCATITGGLDSSSIAVIAADMLAANGSKLNTFTAVPEVGFIKQATRGLYFDETPYVRQIAETNGNISPHFVQPSKTPILEHIAEEIRVGGVPSGGILNGLWVMDIYAAARSLGHNVMLCGELGNTTMSYDGQGLFAELVRRGRWLRLIREIASSGYRWRRTLRQNTILPFIPAPIFRMYREWRRSGKPPWDAYSAIRADSAAQIGILDRATRDHLPFDTPIRRVAKLARVYDLHTVTCETADWYAKLRAYFGIDTRAPSLDRRLVEFCIGVPEDQYLRNGQQRWLIRRAMQGLLPDSVVSNTKRGAQAADWFQRLTRERRQIAAELKRLAGNPDVNSVIDLQRLIGVLDGWPEREPGVGTAEQQILMWIPQALGAANFVESITGVNYASTPVAGRPLSEARFSPDADDLDGTPGALDETMVGRQPPQKLV